MERYKSHALRIAQWGQIEACRKKEIWVSTVERIAGAFSLGLSEFFSEDVPEGAKLAKKVVSSWVHRR